jgi:hypothetical protein
MLAKCANPACNAPFLYLREGRLYQMEVGQEVPRSVPEPNDQPGLTRDRKPVRRLEFFWLCGRCAQQMSLAFNPGRGVVVVPARTQGAVAS